MSSPRQILHLVANLDGYGLTRQLELLAREQLAAGHDLQVIALAANRKATAQLRQLGIRCQVLQSRWQCDPFTAIRLAGELRRNSYDVLHLWGQTALDHYQLVRRWISRRVDRRPWLASLPGATVHNTSRRLAAPLAVDTATPPAYSREQLLAEQRLPDDALLIAVGGPLTRSQRIDEAIWYFELVRTLDERARLLIFGDGPDRPRLERFSRLASEPSAIRFLGYRTDFRQLLPLADLFWHTGAPDDTLPLTVLEAMAAGVPVVVNDSPGCRQAVRDRENGLLVPDLDRAAFARQTRRLVDESDMARSLTTSATQMIAERYSLTAMTEAYSEQYDLLAGGTIGRWDFSCVQV